MRNAVFKHTLRSLLRRSTLLWLVALGGSLSALGALLPVRFRAHQEVLIEAFQATHLLVGLLFAALIALPALRPDQRLYSPARWGLPAARPHTIILWDALATVVALLAVSGGVTLIQGGILLVDGANVGIGILIAFSVTGYVYSCTLVAWGRLLGVLLPPVPGMVVLFALAIAPRWVVASLRADSGGSWAEPVGRLAVLAFAPSSAPEASEMGVVGILLMSGSAAALFLAVNLLVSWSLGHLNARGGALDPTGDGS